MASDTTGNPWKVTSTTTGVLTTRSIILKKLLWDSPTAAHQLTIADNAGKTIYDNVALAGGTGIQFGEDFGDGIVCNGINITVHDGGTLYLYIQ